MTKEWSLAYVSKSANSSFLVGDALGMELQCDVLQFALDEQPDEDDRPPVVRCIVLNFELGEKEEAFPALFDKWRSAYPDVPIIILVGDANWDFMGNFKNAVLLNIEGEGALKQLFNFTKTSTKSELLGLIQQMEEESHPFRRLIKVIRHFTKQAPS